MAKKEVYCETCGKVFLVRESSDRRFCGRPCFDASVRGVTRGKYNQARVDAVCTAKRAAQIKRNDYKLIDNFENIILEYIRRNYISSIKYLTQKVVRPEYCHWSKMDRTSSALIENVLRKQSLYETWKMAPKYPDFIQKMSFEQYDSFLETLKTKSWNDIKIWFMMNKIPFRTSFFGAFWYMTKDWLPYYDKKILFIDGIKSPEHSCKSTLPEKLIAYFLDNAGIKYQEQYPIKHGLLDGIKGNIFYYDFLVEPKLIIEVHGDYFHGNSSTESELNDFQKKSIIVDKHKETTARNLGYNYLVLWEHEINPKGFFITFKTKKRKKTIAKLEEIETALILRIKELL